MTADHPVWEILKDLVSYVPALFCLLLITNNFDSEWLVVAALVAGAGGKALVQNLRKAKVE